EFARLAHVEAEPPRAEILDGADGAPARVERHRPHVVGVLGGTELPLGEDVAAVRVVSDENGVDRGAAARGHAARGRAAAPPGTHGGVDAVVVLPRDEVPAPRPRDDRPIDRAALIEDAWGAEVPARARRRHHELVLRGPNRE